MMCLLISGCGLLKKNVKTSQSSEHITNTEVKEESRSHTSAEVKGESKIVSHEQNQVQKDIDEQTTLTANEIEIKADGSITGKGNANLKHNRKDKGKLNGNKALERTDNYVGHIDVESGNKAQEKQETKDNGKVTTSKSEPKGSMMVWGAIGLLILICGLIWFFRKK